MPTREEYNAEALQITTDMQDRLAKLEADEFRLLSKKWNVVSGELESLINKIAEKEFKTKTDIYKNIHYKEFLRQSKKYIERYDSVASGVILDNKILASKIGTETTYQVLDLLTTNFFTLSPDKINIMVGIVKDTAPLYALLQKSYPYTVDKLADILIKGQALGYNPMKTARLLTEAMDSNRKRALLVARTEQLRSNRLASIESMKQSGVCKGWVRIESIDALTCGECEDANGSKHGFDEPFDTHPNCRGASAPWIE